MDILFLVRIGRLVASFDEKKFLKFKINMQHSKVSLLVVEVYIAKADAAEHLDQAKIYQKFHTN